MAITPLPDVPLRSDAPATFVTKADAFLGALNQFATEVDAVGVALTLGATNSTSTTSLLIGVGSKSLTVQTGKSYVVGMTVKIASTATGVNWMLGDITSYTTGTGALVVTVVGISGSGTFAVWSISQSATGGAKLGINSDITSLTALDTSVLNIGSGQVYKDASGNVGIGTSSPITKLSVSQDTNAQSWLALRNTNAGSSASSGLLFGNDVNLAYGALYVNSSTNTGFGGPNSINLGSYGAYPLTFLTSAIQRMTIDSVGNVTLQENISVGGAVPTTSGTGITFPAAQSASTDANTIDDYEEGVWTPVLTFATTGTMTYTASTEQGIYTKIGNVVTCRVALILTAFTAGTASGQARISLPFASIFNYCIGPVDSYNFTTTFPATISSTAGASYSNLSGKTAINTNTAIIPPANFATNSQVFFSITYTA